MEQAISVQELLKGIWRRRALVLLVAAAIFIVGAILVMGLPKVWRATSVVRVDPRRPSPELVQATVTQPIEDRLRTVRQELFARPLLEKLIVELNLFPKDRNKKGIETAVGKLRSMLDVKVEGDLAFELQVQGDDPKLVARIANRLPALYAEHALQTREDQAQIAATLFDDEINRIGTSVEALEAKMAAFKIAHLGELPEQIETNMRALERTTSTITARNDTRRELMRRMLEIEESASDADTEVGRLRRRALDLNRELDLAISQWTGDHPEVLRLRRELETVAARRAEADARARQSRGEKGFVRQQLQNMAAEITAMQNEAKQYRERLDRTPRWAHELNVMSRDYELLRTKYQSLLSRKVEAEVARDLEAKSRAGMFQVVSAAAVPPAPFKPDRPTGLFLALLAAIAGGLLAGVFAELKDDSLRRVEQARELSVPVLAMVPRIPGGGRGATRRV